MVPSDTDAGHLVDGGLPREGKAGAFEGALLSSSYDGG